MVSAMAPHNVPFVVIGAGLLWFGWFGFNAGSALTSGGLAASAFVATNTAAAAAALNLDVLELVLSSADRFGHCYRSSSRTGGHYSGGWFC